MEIIHPIGESLINGSPSKTESIPLDTFAGRIHIEWDSQAEVTPFGQLPFFIDFLKTAELYQPWVDDCPLVYTSPNAPLKADVLGTLFLSILSGHNRYAHITTIRSDQVNPGLLGMKQVMSEDSARRAFQKADEKACAEWLQTHLRRCYEPLLYEPWILDVDMTVKPLYGNQEGAVVGYNPKKRGRPSHAYHTYGVANLRLILDVEVQPGNQTASSFARPRLWSFLDSLPKEAWPTFLRGDCDWGNENVMAEAERRELPYVFKLRQSKNVKRLVEEIWTRRDWVPAGQGWEGVNETLQLQGWTKSRRVVVLRREVQEEIVLTNPEAKASKPEVVQLEFAFVELMGSAKRYEYAVLVTSRDDEILTVAQHYRDRGDAENVFDELKNQWGWNGYMTQDIKRCQIMARMIALVYNWWSLFVRLAIPEKHAEAITSRPMLLNGIAKQTRHSGQTTITVTSLHGKTQTIQEILRSLTEFLSWLKRNAEQLDWEERWRCILSRALRYFLGGRLLKKPNWLPATS